MYFLSILADVEKPVPAVLDPNLGLVLWTAVVVGVVIWALSKWAWPVILNGVQERERSIDESLSRAEKALEEAKQLAADNETARREAELEGQRILREAREASDQLRTTELDKTKAAIKQMQEQARAEIEQEKQSALSQLRAEVSNLAIGAAEKVLGSSVDGTENRKLVDDFIDGLPKN